MAKRVVKKKRTEKLGPLVEINEAELFHEGEFLDDVDINLERLDADIVRHPGLYWKYGKLHAAAMRMLEECQGAIDVAKAEQAFLVATLTDEYRQELTDQELRITDKTLENLVVIHPKYRRSCKDIQELQNALRKIRSQLAILALTEKIFSKRTDLLSTLGYMHQAEYKSSEIPSRVEAKRQQLDKLKSGARRALSKRRR